MKLTAEILTKLKLKFEPNKTNIAHFDKGFDFLGVHFFRNAYSFEAGNKKVEVKGDFDPNFFYEYIPEGYI